MGLGLLFPGQGSQHPAMFKELAKYSETRPVLDALSNRLGSDVRNLDQGPLADRLGENAVAQLLLVGHALALKAVFKFYGLEVVVAAGYSVGEISAHVWAGSIAPEMAFDLTAARAHCMDRAAAETGTGQGMLGLRGLSLAQAERLALETGCAVAIVNGRDHVILGGSAVAIQQAEEQAVKAGARRIKRLPVTVSSHTPFIASAARCFAERLATVAFQQPQIPVLSGIDGRAVMRTDEIAATLSAQLVTRLDWHGCLESALEYGANAFLELGPERSLTKIAEENCPAIPIRAFEDFGSLRSLLGWIARQMDRSY